jgi:hypothetical protein
MIKSFKFLLNAYKRLRKDYTPGKNWFIAPIKLYTVISCLFREQSKLLTRAAGDDLRTVA